MGYDTVAILQVYCAIICGVKGAKIYRVIQIKFIQLVLRDVHMIRTVVSAYLSNLE